MNKRKQRKFENLLSKGKWSKCIKKLDQLATVKQCTKCGKIKQDTAFPIHIGFFRRFPIGIYKECNYCCPNRILKRMDKYFTKIKM